LKDFSKRTKLITLKVVELLLINTQCKRFFLYLVKLLMLKENNNKLLLKMSLSQLVVMLMLSRDFHMIKKSSFLQLELCLFQKYQRIWSSLVVVLLVWNWVLFMPDSELKSLLLNIWMKSFHLLINKLPRTLIKF